MRYVALLRAINLGSVRQVKMADLRSLLEGLGYRDVDTYLQSGNVALTSEHEAGPVRSAIETALLERYDFEVLTIVRPVEELQLVVEQLPYPEQARLDPTRVHAVFVEPAPPATAWSDIDLETVAPEHLTPGPGVVYLSVPAGVRQAKLPGRVDKLAGSATTTSRNWRTVVNLWELAGGAQSR